MHSQLKVMTTQGVRNNFSDKKTATMGIKQQKPTNRRGGDAVEEQNISNAYYKQQQQQ